MTAADRFRHHEQRRLAEAGAWRVALAEADASTSPEFESWLADAENGAAWAKVQASWNLVEDHADAPEMLALRRDALSRAQRNGQKRWSSLPLRRVAAAAILLLLVGTGFFLGTSIWRTEPLVFATSLGERRVVTLVDGSRISLDAASEVRVRYTEQARDIELVRGQARFDVARDVTRRFLVHARDQTIVATGTAFNVDMLGERVLVTLIEGSITVVDSADDSGTSDLARRPDQGVALRAGQQLIAAPRGPPLVQPARIDRAIAWERGQLVFEDETLAEIAERISRYSERPVLVDPSAASQRVSGVFRAGDVPTFVDTVVRYLPVRAAERDDGAIVLRSTN